MSFRKWSVDRLLERWNLQISDQTVQCSTRNEPSILPELPSTLPTLFPMQRIHILLSLPVVQLFLLFLAFSLSVEALTAFIEDESEHRCVQELRLFHLWSSLTQEQ